MPDTVRRHRNCVARLRSSQSKSWASHSDANKKSTIVRSEQTFAENIKDPRAKVHGTKMIFADIENEQRKHKKITHGALARRRGPRFHQQHTRSRRLNVWLEDLGLKKIVG